MQRELKNYGLYGLAHLRFIEIYFKDLNRLSFVKIVIYELLIYQLVTQLTNNQQSKVIRGLFISCYSTLYEDLIKLNLSTISNFLGLISSETESQFNIQNSMPFYGHPDLMLEYN
ncbi:Hypothetical_protein [Hexamita inflata]|uniref:Hypothetical_protein n=1 Tax=Hexamita inflata TaxID=28002 RepID=A0AA86RQJ8_9EUKA|nr:Hypothetical protein HINF_LOCUS63834 [Hexamita inflata]